MDILEGRNLKRLSWRSALAMALLAAAFVYVWILPLFRPRGDFLWGHYSLRNIYLGIPIGLATLSAVIIVLVPVRFRRSLSLRLTTLMLALLLAFAICDVGYAFGVMRVWRANFWLDQAHISRRYSIGDDELGFIRKPNVSWRGYVPELDKIVEYRTDENGFRNATRQTRADIVFIGDSFTEAASVAEDETFVRRVAESTGLSVVNLARGAYGPQQELIVLKRYGFSYKPRIVVWQLFEGNDLADAKVFADWTKSTKGGNTSLKERYFDNSLLNELLADTRLHDGGPMVTLRYSDGTSKRIGLRYRYDAEEPVSNPLGMAETVNAIEAGYRACEAQGIKLIVVFVPTMVRAMEQNISFDRAQDRMDYLPEGKSDGQKDFGTTIKELCTRLGCDWVDGLAPLQRAVAAGNRDIFIPNDEHLDVGAHHLIAQLIVDSLRQQQIGRAGRAVSANEPGDLQSKLPRE